VKTDLVNLKINYIAFYKKRKCSVYKKNRFCVAFFEEKQGSLWETKRKIGLKRKKKALN